MKLNTHITQLFAGGIGVLEQEGHRSGIFKRRITGRVEVNALGTVTRVAVVASSGDTAGHKVLDALALDTISKCAFPAAPGFLPAQSKVAYVWRLTD